MKRLIAAFAAAGIIAAHGSAYAWTETTAPAPAKPAHPAHHKPAPKPPSDDLAAWTSCEGCILTTLPPSPPSPLPAGAAAFSAGQNLAARW
jgi:hypothetical protein